ncbi:MAG TPA: hypothetical protein PKY30_12275, partial [Myxococcota bacterium]|nr:hypothetical protein [Myxococcota bacterium]
LQRHRQSAGRHALPETLLGDDAKVARVCTGSALLRDGRIYVEEFEQGAEENAALDKAAQLLAEEIWPGDEGTQRFFRQRLLLTQNSVFDALARNSLELRTRVCIDGTTGTAADSGPWTEEAMPAETLLAGLVVGRATTVVKRGEREELGTERQLSGGEAIGFMSERWGQGGVLRMGGHTSIGFGRAWFRMVE